MWRWEEREGVRGELRYHSWGCGQETTVGEKSCSNKQQLSNTHYTHIQKRAQNIIIHMYIQQQQTAIFKHTHYPHTQKRLHSHTEHTHIE